MKKLYLLIFLPSLLFSQNIPIIDVGLKLQTSLGNYQNNTPIIYTSNPYYNNFSPSVGVVAGANLNKFKLGAEVLYNFFGPNIEKEEYVPAYAGELSFDPTTGTFIATGAHSDYTLTNNHEAQNSLQLNLFFYYNIINNLYLGVSPYFTSVKNTSQIENWVEDVMLFDTNLGGFVMESMVLQSRADFSWQESGINLSVSYKFLSFIFDLKFPLISAASSITGDHVGLADSNTMQTFEFNKDYLRKPLLFSITYLIF